MIRPTLLEMKICSLQLLFTSLITLLNLNMMNQICSSLISNSRKVPGFYQLYKPRYNKEFFKRLLKNSENLKELISKRCLTSNLDLLKLDINALNKDARKLIELKDQLEKFDSKSEDDSAKREIWSKLEELEERILPIILRIPNRASKEVPAEDRVIEEIESDSLFRDKLVKSLSYTKLSYINNCYSKSVVGPNSHYYFGIGAKLQHGLEDFFATNLECKRDFIPVSGLSLTKSALIEAVNANNTKSFIKDPARVVVDGPSSTTLHLVEASRESLLGFVTTLSPRVTNAPLRLFTSGAGYRLGADWFDPDEKKVAQFETIHAIILNSSIEQHSMKEYHETVDFIWSLYRKLKLPTRLVHCSYTSMYDIEYDAHRIDVWLPSKQSWIETSRISHYLDCLTIRLGLKRGHFIDSKVYDGQALVSAIIENNQTPTGKFIIPSALQNHMVGLLPDEKSSFLSKQTSMLNYEQRRYLVKKTSLFGHSERAEKNQRPLVITVSLGATCLMIIFGFIDWKLIYVTYFSKDLKRFTYDKCFRPMRRIWWRITYHPESSVAARDIPFDELDKTELNPNNVGRRKRR